LVVGPEQIARAKRRRAIREDLVPTDVKKRETARCDALRRQFAAQEIPSRDSGDYYQCVLCRERAPWDAPDNELTCTSCRMPGSLVFRSNARAPAPEIFRLLNPLLLQPTSVHQLHLEHVAQRASHRVLKHPFPVSQSEAHANLAYIKKHYNHLLPSTISRSAYLSGDDCDGLIDLEDY